MKCNIGTGLVCYNWEKCARAKKCPNVLLGMRRSLSNEIQSKGTDVITKSKSKNQEVKKNG